MIYQIPLEIIIGNPWQTRDEPGGDYVKNLAEDIRMNGLLQPPMGRLVDAGGKSVTGEHFAAMQVSDSSWDHLGVNGFRVQLAFGHNRLAAYQYLEAQYDDPRWQRMPVEIRFLDDRQMAAFAWSENEQRKDLSPIERARAIKKRMDGFGWTQEQAGKELGLSRSTIANILRLLNLPEEIGAEVDSGVLSERQAQALVPLYEVPEEVRQTAEKVNWSYIKPSDIVKAAKEGESSDQIRLRVKALVENCTVLLNGVPFPMDYEFETESQNGAAIKSARCEGCTHQIRKDKSVFCTVKACFETKQEIWGKMRLARVSEEMGIPAISEGEKLTEYYFEGDEKIRQAIIETTCEHKRLRQSIWGIKVADGISLVCCHPSVECECLQRIQKEMKENDPEEKAQRELKAKLQKLYDEAGRRIGQALAEDHAPAWLAVLRRISKNPVNENWSAELIREKVGRELVKPQFVPYADLETAQNGVAAVLKAMGLESPDETSAAEEAAKKFERICKWINKLSDDPPTAEALRGNIANLQKIRSLLEGDLEGAVDDALEVLNAVLDVIQEPDWRAADFHWVREILERDAGAGDFQDFIAAAPAGAVRYVLALLKQDEYEYETGLLDAVLAEVSEVER